MPSYDPQRNRARARPAVGDPAPVDQILGRSEPAATALRPAPAAAMAPTALAAATVPPGSPVAHAQDRRRGFAARPVLVAVVATVATVVLVRRRRRGRRA